jgi:CRISPR-associated endonuclease Cas1
MPISGNALFPVENSYAPDRARRVSCPPVIALGAEASLKVRGGALAIEHEPEGKRETMRLDVDTEPKPVAILFDSNGEWMTGEALRWCARYGISVILPDGPGAVMTFIHSALEAESASQLADTSPAVIRAQCMAEPLGVARELVRTKIKGELETVERDRSARLSRLSEWETRIGASRTIGELLIVEAKAAADYWRHFSNMGLREARGGNLPRTWLRFANRQKGAGFLGSKHASHPVNAMLNYAYVVEAGRLAKALVARGLALQIGYLHSDKKGRNSLVWDAIEPMRVEINDKVFRYIESREFKRSDFIQTSASSYRLERDVIQQLLHKASLPHERISEGADFMLQMIEKHAGNEYRLFKQDMRRRKRKTSQVANAIDNLALFLHI